MTAPPALVLVTRPEPGLSHTMAIFEKAGFHPLACPVLSIRPYGLPDSVQKQLRQVAHWDTLIFPSQHAVEQAFAICPHWSIGPATQLISVGKRTAHTLYDHLPTPTENPVLVPEKHNSDGVIELLSGLRRPGQVALITAPNGRQKIQQWFASTQETNPASIPAWREVFVYQRQPHPPNNDCLHALKQTSATGQVVFTLATSTGIVTALLEHWPQPCLAMVQQQPLVCASERIAQAATDAGFRHCLIAEGAAPQQLLAAVQKATLTA